MDILKNQTSGSYDYKSRYLENGYYYNTLDDREVMGLCKNMDKSTSWVAHKIEQEDTLHSLALKYYNNPTYWWVIAYFNDIMDAFTKLGDKYTMIKIPSIGAVSFKELR